MSASQLNVWHECQRKWAWKYVAKLRPEAHKSAALGVKVHAQLERYLKTGEMPDFVADSEAGNIAASGLHHLPKPGAPGLEIEQHFKFQSPATGIWYRGFIDVLKAPGEDGIPDVLDHKTTGDVKWAKTPEDLLEDTQAILYAKSALLRWPDAPKVRLQWTYFQTRKTRKSLPVLQEVSREHVDYMFPLIEKGAQEIVTTLIGKQQPLELPPNPRACGMFGGCPFTAQCNLSPEETIRAMSNADQKTTSLLSRLGTQNAEPAPAPAGGLLGRLMGAKPAEPAPTPAPEEPKLPAWADPAQTPVDPLRAPKASTLPVSDQPINPPEQSSAPTTQAEAAAVLAGQTADAPAPETEEKKGRGRPKGSKNKPKDEIITYDASAAETGRTDASSPNTANTPKAETESGFTLYVDCFPIGRQATTLEKLVARAQAENTAATGKADYRMHDYGQGPGVLSALVVKYVDEGTYGDIVLDSRTPEGAACKSALMAKAAVTVMGLGR